MRPMEIQKLTNLSQPCPLEAANRGTHLLFICLHTLVQLDDMTADKPDQVTEIWDRCLISNVVQHVLVVHWRVWEQQREDFTEDAHKYQLIHTHCKRVKSET